MPVTRIRKAYATYMQLAIIANQVRPLDRTFITLWGGTLKNLNYAKENWSLITGGFTISWSRPLDFLTTSDVQVVGFLYHYVSGQVWTQSRPANVFDQSLEIPCPDVDGTPGYLLFAFIAQRVKNRIVAISPCTSIWGTGWEWQPFPP
jgi:hypothetical protein